MQSLQNAKIQGASGHTGQGASRDVDVRNGDQPSQEEPAAAKAKEPRSSKSRNPVLSEPKTDVTDSTKDGPLRNQNTNKSNANPVLKGGIKANKQHVGYITFHLTILRHFRSTTKVTSSVTKTPTSSSSLMTKANCQAAEKLLFTMNQVQYHARRLKTSRNYTPTLLTG